MSENNDKIARLNERLEILSSKHESISVDLKEVREEIRKLQISENSQSVEDEKNCCANAG